MGLGQVADYPLADARTTVAAGSYVMERSIGGSRMNAYIGYITLHRESAGQNPDPFPATLEQVRIIIDLLETGPLAAWLEDPQRIDGLSLQEEIGAGNVPELMQRWPQGRVFCATADVQWERLPDGNIHVVAISDAALDSAHWQSVIPLEALNTGNRADDEIAPQEPAAIPDVSEYHLLLWGTYNQDGSRWEEGRIPGLNRQPDQEPCYPTHWQGPYAAIVACSYETHWDYQEGCMKGSRTITRYLRYDGNYNPLEDSRLK
jgi:hypothetical protein